MTDFRVNYSFNISIKKSAVSTARWFNWWCFSVGCVCGRDSRNVCL